MKINSDEYLEKNFKDLVEYTYNDVSKFAKAIPFAIIGLYIGGHVAANLFFDPVAKYLNKFNQSYHNERVVEDRYLIKGQRDLIDARKKAEIESMIIEEDTSLAGKLDKNFEESELFPLDFPSLKSKIE